MKKTIFFCIIFFYCSLTFGQKVYNHSVFWGRLVLADKISPKFSWELYLQNRTQNPAPHVGNMFQAHQFSGIWLWINYEVSKNLKLSLSPFGHFNSHVFNTTEADVDLPGVKEFRWTAKVETKQAFTFLNYVNRYSLEYRWRDLENDGVYRPNWRVRYTARLEKPVKRLLSKEKPVTFFVSDEVFIQFGPAVRDNPNVFNQNRINAGVSYEVIKNVKVSLSYLNILQERNTGNEFDNAHAIWVILTFDNLISQFIKKDK